jgi:O-antigen ligase
MTMTDQFIKFLLMFLLVMTPIAFGSVELWAFSSMEIGILLMIVLWAIQSAQGHIPKPDMARGALRIPHSAFVMCLLFLFLCLVFFQMLSLPSGIMKTISSKTFALHQQLLMTHDPLPMTTISFVPFVTKIEFFKWLTLAGFFLFLLNWKSFNRSTLNHLILTIMAVGIAESLYGMLEWFSGHRHVLGVDIQASAAQGTFVNRNYFAGYLLMVIPLSIGYFFSREALQKNRFMGWRHRLSSLDGKTLLIAFGIILMILGLLFSASRMGIVSLLFSFTLISFLFGESQRGQRFSRMTVWIFGLAFLWAAWIGVDAVIGRFFTVSESFEERWKFWVNTFQIFKDFPLFGTGLGTFVHIFPMYRSFHIRGLVSHAENDLLQLLSEVGLIGTGLLVVLFLFLFFKAFSGLRSLSQRDPQKYIGLGGMVGILGLMFHSLVERNIQVPANAFLYTFIFAAALTISTKPTRQTG